MFCSGVKDAVVDAVEELYLKPSSGLSSDPQQAAHNLVSLAQDSSLGRLVSSSLIPPAHYFHAFPLPSLSSPRLAPHLSLFVAYL